MDPRGDQAASGRYLGVTWADVAGVLDGGRFSGGVWLVEREGLEVVKVLVERGWGRAVSALCDRSVVQWDVRGSRNLGEVHVRKVEVWRRLAGE